MTIPRRRLPLFLLALIIAYCLASLAHFIHNAEHLSEYPNLPAWLSRSKVYATWLSITSVGVIGVLLLRSRHSVIGLVTLAIYAAIGFDGLGHYAVAPISAHTAMMNLTIWSEVVAAADLGTCALN